MTDTTTSDKLEHAIDETTQKVDRVETRARCGRLGLDVNRERAGGGLTADGHVDEILRESPIQK